MKLSVVVPAYNEERLLGASLAAIREGLAAFEAAGWEAELVVCDNNSTDRTAEIARAAGARVVFEPINQISRARNTGARAGSGDWLLFVDADSFPSRALFADVLDAIGRGRVLAGGSTLAIDNGPWWGKLGLAGWNLMSRKLRWGSGAFVFCEAAAFREVGGFDETLYASEELELFRRLKRLARRTGRTVEILDRHPLKTSARKLHLYSFGEFARLFLKTLFTFGRTLRRREDCSVWYDGRR
ncbi:MAG TPA: glycosyltransferase [Burkholderiales bacterium]|nr:glycosyltransferase [Burkholderiales bacterium]